MTGESILDFFNGIATAFHLLYEAIRWLWLPLFIGWWALWIYLGKRYNPARWEILAVPLVFTIIGLLVAGATTSFVYTAVNDPAHFSVQLDACESYHQAEEQIACEDDDMRALNHFQSMAVQDEKTDEIKFFPTFIHVFGDTVSFVHILLLWLVLPLFPFWRKASRKRPNHTPSHRNRIA